MTNNAYREHPLLSQSQVNAYAARDLYTGIPVYNLNAYKFQANLDDNDAVEMGNMFDTYVSLLGVMESDKANEEFAKIYTPVERRSKAKEENENVKQVTTSMWKKFETMRDVLLQSDIMAYFTKSYELQKEFYDEELGLKGKPDMYSLVDKHIVDVKTTGNIDMLLKDLRSRGQLAVNHGVTPHHKYIRQAAAYMTLASRETKTGFESWQYSLAIFDHRGSHLLLRFEMSDILAARDYFMEDLEHLKAHRESKDIASYFVSFKPLGKVAPVESASPEYSNFFDI